MAIALHLYLPQMRMTHEAIVERALGAEAAGFEGIAFMDHLAPPMAESHGMWEAMAIAGWVLAKTTTLTVGHLVLCDAFHHPAVLARQVTSLDHASGGRFELGLGWGSVPAEFTTYGVAPTSARQRVGRMAESLSIMSRLWAGETVDHQGEHFTLVGARQAPAPTRPIPIVIGGTGPRTLELVARHADWWNVPIHQLHELDDRRDRIGSARISVQNMVAVAERETDVPELRAQMQRRFGTNAMGTRMVIGTVDTLTEYCRDLESRGIERLYAWCADFASASTLARLGEVISNLR